MIATQRSANQSPNALSISKTARENLIQSALAVPVVQALGAQVVLDAALQRVELVEAAMRGQNMKDNEL